MKESSSSAGVGEIVERLKALGSPERAAAVSRYFKTGPGEYGEGDVFVGIAVPGIRKLARQIGPISLHDTISLLHSPIHEARFLALILMRAAYGRADARQKELIFRTYLANTRFINNWDLVDSSAPQIVGAHLADGNKDLLRTLCASKLLWERRLAIMATFHFIAKGEFSDALEIARLLLDDPSDLIHKAVGWMLREIGKRDMAVEESFLKIFYRRMPRTMLRYAIERFPEVLRRQYLKGDIA
jgi:3-methyladenine DNA glycosylase AlkD